MVKTDKKVVKKPAVKKTVKKATKKTVAKKVTKKTTAKKVTKRVAKKKTQVDVLETKYMGSFLTSMMPEMIGQLKAGVNRDRITEIVAFNRGEINFGTGRATFSFGGESYTAERCEDNFWKAV